jgi:arylsulfatase A-like enzyme
VLPLLLACAAREGRPNVLLVVLDGTRADRLRPWGGPSDDCPSLTRLAARGSLFEAAIAPANEGAWSLGALLAEAWPSQLATLDEGTWALPGGTATLAGALGAAGYRTGLFGGTAGYGLDQGFDRAELGDPGLAAGGAWARGFSGGGDPWFAAVVSGDALPPYDRGGPWDHLFAADPGSELAERLAGPALDLAADGSLYDDMAPTHFTRPDGTVGVSVTTWKAARERGRDTEGTPIADADRAHLLAHYDGALAAQDLQLGRLLSAMEADLRDTVVVVWSPRGADLLDHGLASSRTSLHDSVVRVPLVIAGPGFPVGVRVPGMVEAADIAATIRALAGAPAGPGGRDLRGVARGEGGPLTAAFSEGAMDMVAVRTDGFKLVYHHAPVSSADYVAALRAAELGPRHFELYDLAADPGERQDLLLGDASAWKRPAEDLRARLASWRASIAPVRAEADEGERRRPLRRRAGGGG